jgi:archaellum component FlaC
MTNEVDVNTLLGSILKKLDNLTEGQNRLERGQATTNERLDKIEMRLDKIENKIGGIAQTYEVHETLLGETIIDIRLLKKIVLNQ